MKYFRWIGYVIQVSLIALLIVSIVDISKNININIQYGALDSMRKIQIPMLIGEIIALLIIAGAICFTMMKPTRYNGLINLLAVIIVMCITLKRVSGSLILKDGNWIEQELYSKVKYLIGFPVCIGTYYLYAIVEAFIQFVYPKIKQNKAAEN